MREKPQRIVGDGNRTERITRWLEERREEIERLGKFTVIIDVAGLSIKGQIVPGKEKIG